MGISYRVPTTTNLTGTIPTADAASLGLVTPGGSLVFTLRVDNNVCSAQIYPPTIGGSPASDDCGVLEFAGPSDSVSISYAASHPNGFATYGFALYRGINPKTPPSASGVVAPAPGGQTSSHAVSYLMDACPVAGFAETLNVYAMATDGWSRQSQYDRHAVRAFVLSPAGLVS